jgi:hypothetical protein
MHLTEIERISSGERNVNSTLSTSEGTGWEIFMVTVEAGDDQQHEKRRASTQLSLVADQLMACLEATGKRGAGRS